jgi:hypothetical protein
LQSREICGDQPDRTCDNFLKIPKVKGYFQGILDVEEQMQNMNLFHKYVAWVCLGAEEKMD